MVIAQHLIFTTYGFWLPNDPRGSWSDFVRSWELYWYGAATKVTTRRSVAMASHDRGLRALQKTALRYDPVKFSDQQIRCVARGFERAVVESGYVLLACSIMPEHTHAVVRRHHNRGEQIIGHLKARATQQLLAEGLHPFHDLPDDSGRLPSAWSRPGWRVYLNEGEDLLRAIRYVEENPLKQRRPLQSWPFVRGLPGTDSPGAREAD